MAIKQAVIRPTYRYHPIHWRSRLPREIAIHKRVDKRRPQGSHTYNLIRGRAHRLMMKHWRYRIYMDYYPGLSLWDVWKRHMDKHEDWRKSFSEWKEENPAGDQISTISDSQTAGKKLYSEFQEASLPDPSPSPSPESFIWHVAKCLIFACTQLQSGGIEVPRDDPDAQNPISHLDITPANIFLKFHDPKKALVSNQSLGHI